ncbi:MAG TPA: hypothetical protein PKV33_03925, partial [Methanothrix sp.]|nr:hypothetical protein [Methanothrix sp.]
AFSPNGGPVFIDDGREQKRKDERKRLRKGEEMIKETQTTYVEMLHIRADAKLLAPLYDY